MENYIEEKVLDGETVLKRFIHWNIFNKTVEQQHQIDLNSVNLII